MDIYIYEYIHIYIYIHVCAEIIYTEYFLDTHQNRRRGLETKPIDMEIVASISSYRVWEKKFTPIDISSLRKVELDLQMDGLH